MNLIGLSSLLCFSWPNLFSCLWVTLTIKPINTTLQVVFPTPSWKLIYNDNYTWDKTRKMVCLTTTWEKRDSLPAKSSRVIATNQKQTSPGNMGQMQLSKSWKDRANLGNERTYPCLEQGHGGITAWDKSIDTFMNTFYMHIFKLIFMNVHLCWTEQ